MKLVDNATTIAKNSTAFQLALLTAIVSAVQGGLEMWINGQTPTMALVYFCLSAGTAVARLVFQESISGTVDTTDTTEEPHA